MAGTRSKLGDMMVVSDTPDDQILGRIGMYSHPNEPRSGAKLVRSWRKHGLNPDDLPDLRQLVHVFQSACASVRKRRSEGGQDGTRIEIAADEVRNNGTCDYQITLKVWDRANRVIEHEKGLRLEFDKTTSQITATALDGWDDSLRDVEARVREHYEANVKTVPGEKIRNAVRAQLLSVGAQNLRRKAGGVYFVPKEHGGLPTLPVLEGLRGVLTDLYKEDADFEILTCANAEGEREMVRKHFALNVNAKAEELALKALNRVRAGAGERGVRSDMLANMYDEQRRLLHAIDEFESLVDVESKATARNMKMLATAISQLQALADNPDQDGWTADV